MSNNLKILIVDDEPIIRMDIKGILENAGYQVVGEGSDGFEAIELCKKLKPDVAILDIRMELLDGFAAARVISEEAPDTAIVILTAFSDRDYIEKAKTHQINGYILKPIDEKVLIPNIELAVARKKELSQYKEKITQANEMLESRKYIERAKGILMKEKLFDENKAYNYIRDISKKRNMSMLKVAEIIIKQNEE